MWPPSSLELKSPPSFLIIACEDTRRHRSSGYGVALSILACSAALTSCAETFHQRYAVLFTQDPPAFVPRCNWACLSTCFGCSAYLLCLVACVACSTCLPPHTHFLTSGPVPVAMLLEWPYAFRPCAGLLHCPRLARRSLGFHTVAHHRASSRPDDVPLGGGPSC